VRLTDLPRTTSFRLALLFLLLFGAASLLLFGFLYRETNGYLMSMADDWLRREQVGFAQMDEASFLDRLRAHVIADSGAERPFSLFDASGHWIAGNRLDVLPSLVVSAPLDRPFDFTVAEYGQKLAYRGMVHREQLGNLLLIAQSASGASRFDAVLIHALLVGGLVTGFLGLLGATIAGADAVRRIDAVTDATQRIVAGDLSRRLPVHGRTGDLDRLAHVINGMLDEIERLIQEVKGVCDSIAHDLRTPLTRLLAGLERARRRARSTEDFATAIEDASIETRSVLRTFSAMLRISEVESGARRVGFTSVDLARVVTDVAEFYEPLADEKGVSLVWRPDGIAATLPGDPSLLFEAVGNLIDNAIKFTPSGGRIEVRLLSDNGCIGVTVSDTGPGIPSEERDAVSRRFYRLEQSRNTPGTGLGLALVSAVARLHGMDLVITDAAPGCRITLVRTISESPDDRIQVPRG
jgi:signal transduction histidine kinase